MSTKTLTIDAHHHFWNPELGHYPWMTGAFESIRRPFGPGDLEPLLADAGIAGTVLVQTWSDREETRRFLDLAENTPFLLGVVGWEDLTAPYIRERLSQLIASPNGRRLVGIRHQVHDEVDPDWLARDDVIAGLRAVRDSGLAFDLLVRPRELPAALIAVASVDGLRFVVDHIAKPNIRQQEWQPWFDRLAALAAYRDRVWCKLSGMVTKAQCEGWKPEDFTDYIKGVIGLFGADRCMYGSDWPVCNVAAEYQETRTIVEQAIRELPSRDRAQIMAGAAIEAYRLDAFLK